MATCENCGLPNNSALSGYWLELQFMPRAREAWKRQQKRTVWTCGRRCALETMAIASMGLMTSKWPMTFTEFISQLQAAGKLEFLKSDQRPTSRQDALGRVAVSASVYPTQGVEIFSGTDAGAQQRAFYAMPKAVQTPVSTRKTNHRRHRVS